MKKVFLSGVEFAISRLSFGTASLHHVFSTRARKRLIATALDRGISHFDTSPLYGFGMAERELGSVLARSGSNATVATKVGIYPPAFASYPISTWLLKGVGRLVPALSRRVVDYSVARADLSLNESLKRLRRDHVDILFLHEPRPALLHLDEYLTWVSRVRGAGKIRHCGLAGPAEHFSELLHCSNSLADVLQVADSLEKREADLVLNEGRCLQITYGYFASASRLSPSFSAAEILALAMARNCNGSILLATRRRDRLIALATVAESVEA